MIVSCGWNWNMKHFFFVLLSSRSNHHPKPITITKHNIHMDTTFMRQELHGEKTVRLCTLVTGIYAASEKRKRSVP